MYTPNLDHSRTELAKALHEARAIIPANMDHPFYCDLRTADNPTRGHLPFQLVNWIAACMKGVLEAEYVEDKDPATGRAKKPIHGIAAVPYTGEPFADVLARNMYGVPRLAHPKGECDGLFGVAGREMPPEGATVLIVDDKLSTGDDQMFTVECVRRAGYIVRDLVVFLDLERGGVEYLHRQGVGVHAVWQLSALVAWYRENRII